MNIGYQVVGDAPEALVWCWGWMSHLDLQWTDAKLTRFYERLADFRRVVIYDKPGTGGFGSDQPHRHGRGARRRRTRGDGRGRCGARNDPG